MSRGLGNFQDMTIHEYVSELFSKFSSFESIEDLRPQVKMFVSELYAKSIIPKSSLSNDTEYYSFGVPNISHVWCLLKRQISVVNDYDLYIRLILFLMLSITKFLELMMETPATDLPEYNNLSADQINSFPYLIARYLCAAFQFALVISPNALLLENSTQFKNEIQKKYYSIASFYLFTIIYEVIINVVLAILHIIVPVAYINGFNHINSFHLLLYLLTILLFSIHSHFYIIIGFLISNKSLLRVAITIVNVLQIYSAYIQRKIFNAILLFSGGVNVVSKIVYYLYLIVFALISSYTALPGFLMKKHYSKIDVSNTLVYLVENYLNPQVIVLVIVSINIVLICIGAVILRSAITFRLRINHKGK